MTELERALVLLGRELELPAAPDLAGAVRPRLARRRRRWWPVVVAVALAAALAVAFAVPGSRAALLRFFHLRGAEVSIVDRLPEVPAGALRLGEPTTLDALGFRPLLLDGQKPDAVYRGEGVVWLRYGQAGRPRALLAEFAGSPFLKKVAGGATTVEYVSIGGYPGIWIAGGHVLFLPGGRAQLAGRTLIWEHGALTLRLEADVSREEAIKLALRVR
jgi:hypothetical protein